MLAAIAEAGREATAGGREQLTLAEVYELYGGKGSDATRRLSEQLGVSQRQVQRMVAGPEASERRGMGPKSMRFFRELSDREIMRAGVRAIRDRGLVVDEGSTFAMCYRGRQDGREREIRGDPVLITDNDDWLDEYEAGNVDFAAELFTQAFLDAYGGIGGGDLEICDEDGGSGLSFSLGE